MLKHMKYEKLREYKYDNLKFLMIFFVVFGHCLELIKGNISYKMYIVIYTFTMPVFVYISGYFAKCKKKNILKYCWIYIICQTVYCLLDKYVFKISVSFLKPNWLLWYMFSLIIWTLVIKIFDIKSKKRSLVLIVIAFVISLIAGFFDFIGYDYSLSRIITFFPYFLLGYYTKNEKVNLVNIRNVDGKINKKLLAIWGIIFIITFIYFWNLKGVIEARWLYGSFSYNNANYTYVFKLMWILLSLVELVVCDNFISTKKIPIISTIGANTLYIYLFHGIILKFFKYKRNIFIFSQIENLILAFVITLGIMMVFGYTFNKIKLLKIKK